MWREDPSVGKVRTSKKEHKKSGGHLPFRRGDRRFGAFYHPRAHRRTKIGGGGATEAQIHPDTEGRGPRPRRSPHRGDPYILCPSRLCQQQEWSVLAQNGDIGQDIGPFSKHRPAPPPFTKTAWPNRVRRTKTAQGEVQLLSVQGRSYCAHHRTRASFGKGRS